MSSPAPTEHIPVLLQEVLGACQPVLASGLARITFLDGTLGRAGHLEKILALDQRLVGLGLDRDLSAIQAVASRLEELIAGQRLRLYQRNFMHDPVIDEFGKFDLMLLDLGVSSPQLDQAGRGFSFYQDGPLDMRMDRSQGFTAADIIAELSEDDLNELFQTYGEIHKPYRVVRAIVHDRKTNPFATTFQLAGLIERVQGWARRGFHPATPFFLALRLKVNGEIDFLEQGLLTLVEGLSPGGRLMVISFHSLEDRIIKNVFKGSELGFPVNKKVIVPTDAEVTQNPRSRSAKLRVFQKSSSM